VYVAQLWHECLPKIERSYRVAGLLDLDHKRDYRLRNVHRTPSTLCYRRKVPLDEFSSVTIDHRLIILQYIAMALQRFDGLELPAAADFHVHLRDGEMMETVTPTIRKTILSSLILLCIG